MTLIVDTDVLVDLLSGNRRLAKPLFDSISDGLYVSIITVGELYEGAFRTAAPNGHLAALRDFLAGYEVLNLTDEVMVTFARERARLRRSGELIPDMDLLIAATALAHDLELVTRNDRHFRRVEGLRLLVPS